MSLRGKLLVAQLPLVVALLFVGAVSLRATRELGSSSTGILKDNYRSVLAAQRMDTALEGCENAATALVLHRTDGAAHASDARQHFDRELQVQQGNVTEPGEQEATGRLRQAWQGYTAALDHLLAVADPSQREALLVGEVQPRANAVRAASDEILAINQEAMVRKSDRARAASQRVDTLLLLATVLALIAGGVASSTLTTRLLRPLSVLSQAARRIGQGDLEARARVDSADEVGQLAREFNVMADHLRKYRETSLGELLQVQGAAQAAIDSLTDAVIAFDAAGSVLAANHVAERELHLDLASGLNALAGVEPELRPVLEQLRARVLGGKGPYQPKGYEEAIRVAGTEGERWLLPRASPIYAEVGAVTGATVVLQDVTRLRRFDELKNDLVATVAHEFRTPLTSLRMAIHLCLEGAAGPVTEKQLDLLHAARLDCERLQGIVDDLLDLSKVQSGQITLEKRRVPVQRLLHDAVAAASAKAAERNVALGVEDLSGGAEVEADPERLELVFSNLLANAIRYSPTSSTVTLRALPLEGALRFEVVDEGPGVPESYRERVFEKYFRVPGAPSGAAGLGLYIAREIVGAHQGSIGVEPGRERGSVFWFTLPGAPS